jgi:hypothetical protein
MNDASVRHFERMSEELVNANPHWRSHSAFAKRVRTTSVGHVPSVECARVARRSARASYAKRVQMKKHLSVSRAVSLGVPLGALWLVLGAGGCSSESEQPTPPGAGSTGVSGAPGSGTAGTNPTAGTAPVAGTGVGGAPSGGSGGTGVAGASAGGPAGGTTPTAGSGGSSMAGSSAAGTPSGGSGTAGTTAGMGGGAGTGTGGSGALNCTGSISNSTMCTVAGGVCPQVYCGLLRLGLRDCTCMTPTFKCGECVFPPNPLTDKPATGGIETLMACPATVPGDNDPCGMDMPAAPFTEGFRCAGMAGTRLCGCGKRPDGMLLWDCDSIPGSWDP